MRDSYVRTKSALKKKLPSGSAAHKNPIRNYKYSGEMAFLEAVLNLEDVDDTMDVPSSNAERAERTEKVGLTFQAL